MAAFASPTRGPPVRYVFEMIREGWNLQPYDPYLPHEIALTEHLALWSTGIALLLGAVPAYLLGVRTSGLSRRGLIIANAGLGLPAVAVGGFLVVLLPGQQPWGGEWLFSFNAIVLGQTLISFPIIVAITAAAIRGLPDGLVEQARAYGASGWHLGVFVFREARIGVTTAVILSAGSAIAEVGAVTILGGNYQLSLATVSSQILNDVDVTSGGSFAGVLSTPAAVEHSIVALKMILVLGVALTIVQQWGSVSQRLRRRPVRVETDGSLV